MMRSGKFNIPHFIVLYNRGILTAKSDPFFYRWGYKVIRKGGKVIDIIPNSSYEIKSYGNYRRKKPDVYS